MPLYEKHNYINTSFDYFVSREIIEYDISSGGYNVAKYFRLLSDSKLAQLENLPKKERQISLGYMQRYDKEFANKLNDGFVNARKLFFEANNIKDDEVLSIKKDAIFMLRRCSNNEFDNLIFKEKNKYSSYFYMNKKEFYLGESLDIKGISDEKLLLHKKYMVDLLFRLLKMIEISSKRQIIVNLKELSDFYKRRQLAVGYYRELNADSLFRLKSKLPAMNEYIGIDYISENEIDDIEIEYNYMKYIVPLINIML